MKYLIKRKAWLILLFIVLIPFIQSCMMMGPSHMSSHASHSHQRSNNNVVYDPVCGVEIGLIEEELSLKYGGETYFFHSENCMEAFQNSPNDFINLQNSEQRQRGYLWGMGGIAMGVMMVLMIF